MRLGGGDADDGIAQHLRILECEVKRALKRGVPDGMDRDDLISEANGALTEALRAGNGATRLAIRNAIRDRIDRESTRSRYIADEGAERIGDFKESVIGELVLHLAQRQMQAVRLVYYFGLTEAEAAGEMQCSQPVVHRALTAAITALRKKLQAIGY
ncbi:MAG: sigma-70 family RNA polymerase sigma factor [Bryobacteraceae bacterium]